jgi:hypothetical protein
MEKAMRKTALFLALVTLPYLAQGQSFVVSPYISTKAIASCVTYPGVATVSATAKPFGSCIAGLPVYGVGVPAGTVVVSKNATDSIVTLSNAMTQGGTKTLEFGYYINTTYASGDWLGLPFKIYDAPGVGGEKAVVSIVIDDQTDQLDSVDVVFFSAYSDTLGLDSAAVNIPAAQALKIVGIVNVTNSSNANLDFGGGRIIEAMNLVLAVPKDALWARLISRQALISPTVVVQPFRVRIGLR